MDIIYTAAFEPYTKRFPWANIESFVQSWVLSVEYVRREFPDASIKINTFDELAEAFFERLALPGVIINPVRIGWSYGPMWVLPKLYSYAQAAGGELLHLDHDVFLHDGFRAVFDHCLSTSDFMFQQPEGMSIYFHGRIASDTNDGLSYWRQSLASYPNVGFFYAKRSSWAKRLLLEAEGFIQRNAYYCHEFNSMLMALALEQQPIGVIASQRQTSWLLANEAEWGAIMNVEPSAKRISHFMGNSKKRTEVLRWLDAAYRAVMFDYQKFDNACGLIRHQFNV